MEGKRLREERPRKTKTGAQTHEREKARAPGDKLKNETSARKAMRQKIRSGKSDNGLSEAEKKAIRARQVRGRKAIDRDLAARTAAHRQLDAANEDQNVAVQAVNDTSAAAGGVLGEMQSRHYSQKLRTVDDDVVKRKECAVDGASDIADSSDAGAGLHGNAGGKSGSGGGSVANAGSAVDGDASSYTGPGGKLGRNARAANQKGGAANQSAGDVGSNVSEASRAAQKRLMQKEFQRTAAQMSEKEAANRFGSKAKRFVDKAEDLVGRLGEWLKEFAEDHAVLILVLLVIVMVVVSTGSCASSGGLLIGTFGHSTVESSYTADDDEILAAEKDYKKLEKKLQKRIDNIESEFPGYDEYQYNLAEINHNPYELAALLTVLYEDYEEEEVREKLQEIFDKQYELTTEAITETRTRIETRTEEVIDEEGNVTEEEYEVEVEYEYHILKVTLTNKTMAEVVRQMGLSDDEMARYELLVETLGNKPELFADDIYAEPDVGDFQDYDIPAEALTNEKFANMIDEAEKYLGYPYVWGGSSPSTSFDCSGFVSYVINHCGNGWNVGRQTANGLLNNCTKVSKSEAQPGDLIFFEKTYNTSGASHVGIYVGDGMMLHCGNPIQYTSINTNYWQSHFYTFGRIK